MKHGIKVITLHMLAFAFFFLLSFASGCINVGIP